LHNIKCDHVGLLEQASDCWRAFARRFRNTLLKDRRIAPAPDWVCGFYLLQDGTRRAC
jgi:hypothetical protein